MIFTVVWTEDILWMGYYIKTLSYKLWVALSSFIDN